MAHSRQQRGVKYPSQRVRQPHPYFRPHLELLEARHLLSGAAGLTGHLQEAFGQASLSFEPNQGQTARGIDFLARGSGYTLFLSPTETVLLLNKPIPPPAGALAAGGTSGSAPSAAAVTILRMQLVGGNLAAEGAGLNPLPGKSNYLTGGDSRHWLTDIPNYARVEYQEVYPGIDMVYHAGQGQLEYDFVVAPGADPGVIALSFQGADSLELDGQGNLVVHTAGGDVVEHAPVVYQETDGVRQPIPGGYVQLGGHQVGFQVGSYDAAKPLIIDPVLVYSTYFGGSKNDFGRAIAVDGDGNVYLTGETSSINFPVSAMPLLQRDFEGSGTEAFVTKLGPGGARVYSTYLGGNPDQSNVVTVPDPTAPGGTRSTGYQFAFNSGSAIAVDGKGNAYVTGRTVQRSQPDLLGNTIVSFPSGRNASRPTPSEGVNTFVVKLDPSGAYLEYSTYVSINDQQNYGTGIALGTEDSAFVTGVVSSTDSAFVVRFDRNGEPRYTRVLYGSETAGIAVDGEDNAYVTGTTRSDDFPTDHPPEVTHPGNADAFVVKIDPDGAASYAVRLGGSRNDFGYAIAVDATGGAYVTGATQSDNFPTKNPLQPSIRTVSSPYVATTDAFVAKLDPTGLQLIYSTYLGGNRDESGNGIAVDGAGNAYVTGATNSDDFLTVNAMQPVFGGGAFDAFVTKLDASGSGVFYSTYLGGGGGVFNADVFANGQGKDIGAGIAVDDFGNAYVTGWTGSTDFPKGKTSPFQPAFAGGEPNFVGTISDAFIAKIANAMTVTAKPVNAIKGQQFTGEVASFTAPDFDAAPGDFSAFIDWGDGTLDVSNDIRQDAGPRGAFHVFGNHAYMQLGAFPVVVTVSDNKRNVSATTAYGVGPRVGNQPEPSIAINPKDPSRLFALSMDEKGVAESSFTGGGGGLFAAYSTDGGITWLPSDLTNGRIGDGDASFPLDDDNLYAQGDPRAAFDRFGNLFLTYLAAGRNTIVVAQSSDGGKSFQKVAAFSPEGSTAARGPQHTLDVDQPTVTTGPGTTPDTSSVWVTYEDRLHHVVMAAGASYRGLGQVVVPFGAAQEVPDSLNGRFGDISIGPKGQVLAAWQAHGAATQSPEDLWVSLDPDGVGGAGFGSKQMVATTNVTGFPDSVFLPLPGRKIGPEFNLAWDRSAGPHEGRVYAGYTQSSAVGATDTRVHVRYSDADGKAGSWSEPVVVSDAGSAGSQLLPSIAVDQSTGDVGVIWYDTRNDVAGVKTQVFAAVSGDGGQHFSANVPVSLGQSDASAGALTNFGTNLGYGDFTGLVFAKGFLHPAWADNSAQLGSNPDLPQFDLAVARVAVAHVAQPKPALTPTPLAAKEGQQFTKVVATFTHSDLDAPAGQFTATIAWGDGNNSPANPITQPGGPGTPFQVSGTHTYAREGAYAVLVKVTDTATDVETTTHSNISQRQGNDRTETMAIDPNDPARLFAASMIDGLQGLSAAYSTDGGLTWESRILGDGSDGLPEAASVPAAAFDQFGNLFLAYIDSTLTRLIVALSPDGGQTFRLVLLADTPGSVPGTVSLGRPLLVTGPGTEPGRGSVWIGVINPGKHVFQAIHAPVTGLDGVRTTDFIAQDVPETASARFGSIAVGPTGQVLVSFQQPSAVPGVDTILTSLDPDGMGPAGFTPPQVVADTRVGGRVSIPAQDTAQITAQANLAWDRGRGEHQGRVYLAYTDAPAVGNADTGIYVRYSDDDGVSWSSRVRVSWGLDNLSRPTEAPNSQFLPRIAVDLTTGVVAAVWHDARNDDNGNKTTEFFAALSGDGGQTFSPNVPVSLGTSDATDASLNSAGRANQYGDYTALAFSAGIFHPLWADNSAELGSNPDLPQFDLATVSVGVAFVARPRPTVLGRSLDTVEGQPFTRVVATFTDPDPTATASQFKAEVAWGDGSVLPNASITQPGGPGTTFEVSGTYTYHQAGTYPVVVTVHDLVDDVQATTNSNVSRAHGNQAEGTVAVDPIDPSRLFAASVDEEGVTKANSGTGGGLFAAYSTDGGVTWQGRLLADGTGVLPASRGDPRAVFDSFGNLFLTYLTADRKTIVVALSTDGGKSFSLLEQFTDPIAVDQPSLAAGPGRGGVGGSVWLTYAHAAPSGELVVATAGAATGRNAVGTFSVPQDVPDSASGNFGSIAVGPSGQVLVNWQDRASVDGSTDPQLGPNNIWVSLDPDGLGPAGFGLALAATVTNVGTNDYVPASALRRIDAAAGLAWDRSGGPHHGRAYLVYTDSPGPDINDTILLLRTSDDNGTRWSDPVRVDDTAGTDNTFLPSIAVDQTTGNVAVAWYDTRNSPDDTQTQFFAALSGDGGRSFSPSVPVSAGTSDATDPDLNVIGALVFQYGDYTDLVFHRGVFYPAWADNSAELGSNPDRPQFDLAVGRIGVVHVADAPLHATGKDVGASRNMAFTGVVASFTDENPFATVGDFTATITWGDGQSSGGVVTGIGSVGFDVTGTHTYTTEGTYAFTVVIKDRGGSTATAFATATVVNRLPQPQPAGPAITAFQGLGTGFLALANFTLPAGAGAGPYTATINWADGSPAEPATVRISGGTVTVSGDHTYAAPGAYQLTLTLTDAVFGSVTATSTINVLLDVTARVQMVSSGLVYNPLTELFNGHIRFTNTGTTDIPGPLPVVLLGLPAGVTLANATGTMGAGDPFITDPVVRLAPGQFRDIPIQFRNPAFVTITYTPMVFDPPPVGQGPVQLVSVTDPSLISASGNGPSQPGRAGSGYQPGLSMSADGRYVAFVSSANNLLTNSTPFLVVTGLQVFVRDLQLGTTTLVSVDRTGTGHANAHAANPVISPDGRYVLFTSVASNLVAEDTREFGQLFVRDLQAGTTALVTVNHDGTGGSRGYVFVKPLFSADGRFVFFENESTDLVANDAVGGLQLFVRDLQLGTTTLVSVNTAGTDGANNSPGFGGYAQSVSADGRYVAFQTRATNLVANDQIGGSQVFVRDLRLGTTSLVSVNRDGTDAGKNWFEFGNGYLGAYLPQISADGRVVVFSSFQTDLLPNDIGGGAIRLFVRDLQTATTSLAVSQNGASSASLSADGRYVAFQTQSALVADDTNGTMDVYVRDLQAGTTTLVRNSTTVALSETPRISADGRFVTFRQRPLDSNVYQLFVRDLQTGTTSLVSANLDGVGGEGVNNEQYEYEESAMSADSRFIVFWSHSNDLVAKDYNGSADVFQWDLQTQTTALVSVRDPAFPNLTGSYGSYTGFGIRGTTSRHGSVSADGRYVAFVSDRVDLVSNVPSGSTNVFVRDLRQGTTTLVSVNRDGTGGTNDGSTNEAAISADGRFVAFISYASNLVAGTTIHRQRLFVRDLQLGTTTLVSVNREGTGESNDLNGQYEMPEFSADGRFLAFVSTANDLAAGTTTHRQRVYVRDLVTGSTTLASVNLDGTDEGTTPVLSADGRFVAFQGPFFGTFTTRSDVFVRDLQLGITTLVSANTAGSAGGNGFSHLVAGSLSADSRYLAFSSNATDLVSNFQDSHGSGNVFVRDLWQGTTTLVTVSRDGTRNSQAFANNAVISADGRFVAFGGKSNALVPNNPSGLSGMFGPDIYVRDLREGVTSLVSVNTAGTDGSNSHEYYYDPVISADGRFVIFRSDATNLVANDAAGGVQVYVRDLWLQTTKLVSINRVSNSSVNGIPVISADGSTVVFTTTAPDLVANDFNYNKDVFAYVTTPPNASITAAGASVTAIEGAPFTGLVAVFTDTEEHPLGNYTARIDWGDGTTTPGTVTANTRGGFDVTGTHTFRRWGFYPITVTVQELDGSTATASTTVAQTSSAGVITYPVIVDTSALNAISGLLAFQFNPGGIPDAQPATVTVSNFAGTVGAPAGPLQLDNTAVLNRATWVLTYDTGFRFDVTFSGDALQHPTNGLFGSTFAVQLLAADGVTPQLTTDPSGAVLTIDINPDGTATARYFLSNVGQGKRIGGAQNVADAPLTAAGRTLSANAGAAFTEVVASFTDANPFGRAEDFSATITWGGGIISAGTVTANSLGGFDVTGTNVYTQAGAYAVQVAVTDSGGARATASSTAVVASSVNNAPNLTVPGPQTGTEDTDLRITGIHVTDVDAGTGRLEVTLTAHHGMITLGPTSGLTFSVGDGMQDATMTFQGSLAALDAALASLIYHGGQDYDGADVLSLAVNDLGNGGGSALTDGDVIAIALTPVNDKPVITAPATAQTFRNTPLNLAGKVTITDVDSNGRAEKVTLAVTRGTLSLGATVGLTFAQGFGNNKAEIRMTGTLTAITASLKGLRYTPTRGMAGTGSLQITVDDLGNSGGPNAAVPHTVALTVVARPPVLRGPLTYRVSGNRALDIPVANGIVARAVSPDGASLTAHLVGPVPVGLTFRANGSIRYEPRGRSSGVISFRVRVFDGLLFSDPINVMINFIGSGRGRGH